ncbi:MAG: site-specific DNA-methyltransferase [Candidatus Riflebacteria bacterium]|nr:site-specific DNA-methyltransferase [Candidatus Riflebacteria bacterium]
MIKDILESNENISANDHEINFLKKHFPGCFDKDGKFDIERFKSYINDKIDIKNEGYELKFLGKNYARLLASLDTTTIITPDKAHNEKPENKESENLYITGDNLDALKHLLKSYSGKIKCIYIDPPYNTGSDGFVYNDKFDFTLDDLMTKLSIGESQAQRILDLTKRGSASHSAWLMFMCPRLQLARDLMSEDGVIFISIDDNEQANLKLICDDIFGEENFVAQLIWERAFAPKNDAKYISNSHDYVCMYAKRIDDFTIGRLPRTKEANERYSNPDDDPRGPWMSSDISVKTYSAANDYSITTPSGHTVEPPAGRCWRLSKKSFLERLHDNRIWFGPDGDGTPRIKRFLSELKFDGMAPVSIQFFKEVGHSQEGAQEVVKLFDGKGVFDGPKPTRLLKRLITLANLDAESIVLDFFSGSATTADAVMQMNAEDGGKRKFIMVQLPEKIEENKPAYKAGYHSIDEIGRERIIRAAKKIKEENTDTTDDLGFKHFILKEPAGKQLADIVEFNKNLGELFVTNNIVEEFGVESILATWLVRDGYGFSLAVQTLRFADYRGYWIDKHLYLIEKGLDNAAMEAIVAKFDNDSDFNPENVVFFGYSFTWTQMESLQINLKRLKATEKNLRINFDTRY